MTISDYITRIKKEIASSKLYEDEVPIWEEYKEYLESELLQNPVNVGVACQLAAVYNELRYSFKACIEVLCKLQKAAGDALSPAEKSRVLTNLAFYYEEIGEDAKCISCLREAAALKPRQPNAYDALARFLIEEGEFSGAVDCCRQAVSLSKELKYHYNYAVALYRSGHIQEAKELFEVLALEHKQERRVLFGLAVCCYYSGEKERAYAIADELAKEETDDYIAEFEIAQLYFLCGDYAKHNAMHDNTPYPYYETASWLSHYFYCLFVLGKTDELKAKLNNILQKKDEMIADREAAELDTDETPEGKAVELQQLREEKNEIEEAYNKIINLNEKPEINIKLWFMYGCYLIDCVRHSDWQENTQ
ncbi:MAG: hypothetical protein LBS74_06090 [Oscillospiraceae bacterium]|nr:hypothetical protein [Oscillospiraceae bacterium]